jgi:hypothetical protein
MSSDFDYSNVSLPDIDYLSQYPKSNLKGLFKSSIDNKDYVILFFPKGTSYFHVVIDNSDLLKVLQYKWFYKNGYVGTDYYDEPNKPKNNQKRKSLYLHNLINNTYLSINHINGCKMDNRNANLINGSSDQIVLQDKIKNTNLPDNAGIKPDDIPRYISFNKETGGRGNYFMVEIKELDIYKKTSQSKQVSLKLKLDEAIKIKDQIFQNNPQFVKKLSHWTKLVSDQKNIYNQIIKNANYPSLII